VRPVVHVDNEHSQSYTVLEIVAEDAMGLLHRISRTISSHGCSVDLVLIATEGHKAIDVFHVTKDGAKLTKAMQRTLADDLERVLLEERHAAR
jgi:[protein-PII] uridylyltransferase